MSSATPVANDRFMKWAEALEAGEPEWIALEKAGVVRVPTRDVVEAELLKTTIELIDYQSGTEESLDGVLATLKRLDAAVADEERDRSSRERSTSSRRATRRVARPKIPRR